NLDRAVFFTLCFQESSHGAEFFVRKFLVLMFQEILTRFLPAIFDFSKGNDQVVDRLTLEAKRFACTLDNLLERFHTVAEITQLVERIVVISEILIRQHFLVVILGRASHLPLKEKLTKCQVRFRDVSRVRIVRHQTLQIANRLSAFSSLDQTATEPVNNLIQS